MHHACKVPKPNTAAGASLVCTTYTHGACYTLNYGALEHSNLAAWSGEQVQVVLQAACTQARLQTCSPTTWNSRSLGREDCLSIERRRRSQSSIPVSLCALVIQSQLAEGLLPSAALPSALDRRQGEAGTRTSVGLRCLLSIPTVLLSKHWCGNLSTVFS